MLTELIWGITKAEVGVVQFDAMLTETHTAGTVITEHPVEEGSDIADHIRPIPKSVELNGLITQNPIIFMASIAAPSPIKEIIPTQSYDRVGDAYTELERSLREDGGGITILTTLRSYENMACESMVVHRDAENGNVLNVTLSFKEIKKVTPLLDGLAVMPDPEPVRAANRAAKNMGNKAKQEAQDAQQQSALSALTGLAG